MMTAGGASLTRTAAQRGGAGLRAGGEAARRACGPRGGDNGCQIAASARHVTCSPCSQAAAARRPARSGEAHPREGDGDRAAAGPALAAALQQRGQGAGASRAVEHRRRAPEGAAGAAARIARGRGGAGARAVWSWQSECVVGGYRARPSALRASQGRGDSRQLLGNWVCGCARAAEPAKNPAPGPSHHRAARSTFPRATCSNGRALRQRQAGLAFDRLCPPRARAQRRSTAWWRRRRAPRKSGRRPPNAKMRRQLSRRGFNARLYDPLRCPALARCPLWPGGCKHGRRRPARRRRRSAAHGRCALAPPAASQAPRGRNVGAGA